MVQEWALNVEMQTVITAAGLFLISWIAISWLTHVMKYLLWLLTICLLFVMLVTPDTAQRIASRVTISCLETIMDWVASIIHHAITNFMS
jgi:hypothetical protein